MEVELSVPIKEGRMSAHMLLNPLPFGPSSSDRNSVGSLLSDEVRRLRDRVYAIEIAPGQGPDVRTAAQADKPGTLEVLRQDVDALGCKTRGIHGRVNRHIPASALKKLRRGLEALSLEVHGQMSTRLMDIDLT
ncbi:Hypothetical protein PHPALM_7610 [Phytophthora palmivora]|uniref:Uncharacterized protein n=1 Tax=Phytophthora palmivora TaxID=4796 RepID=A0A2P4YBV7_9STRA|nr:Hypothetical protein PHPALM_7610 [Phytophthora palmivora]